MIFVHSGIENIVRSIRRLVGDEEAKELFSNVNGMIAFQRGKSLRKDVQLIKKEVKMPLLYCDSGAYTLHKKINGFNRKNQDYIISYVQSYVKFIKDTRDYIDYFIEVDYPEVFGYEFQEWQRQVILKIVPVERFLPVFHSSEPDDVFYELTERFDYIAIQDIHDFNYDYERYIRLCNYAISKGKKLHALTLKDYSLAKIVRFYSMDCTSMLSSIVFGSLPIYDQTTMSFSRIPKDIYGIERFDFGKYTIDNVLVETIRRYVRSRRRRRTIYEDYPVFCKFLINQYKMFEEDITRLWTEKEIKK